MARETLLDVLLRRSRSAPPRLDAFVALPAAAETLEAATRLRSSGEAAVCFKSGSEAAVTVTCQALSRLLDDGIGADAPHVIRREWDIHDLQWIVLAGSRLDRLVTAVHTAATMLAAPRVGAELVRSVFGWTGTWQTCYLVYLHRRATFYPFAPLSGRRRDAELELRVRDALQGVLPMEDRRDRWSPLWELPLT